MILSHHEAVREGRGRGQGVTHGGGGASRLKTKNEKLATKSKMYTSIDNDERTDTNLIKFFIIRENKTKYL